MRRLIYCLAALFSMTSLSGSTGASDPVENATLQRLKQTAQQEREATSTSVAELLAASAEVQQTLGTDHFASTILRRAEQQGDIAETIPAQHRALRQGLLEAHEALTFKPLIEAKLPVGYPDPTPVHHIEVKTLPVYRLAKVEMRQTGRNGENSAFWSLFQHIKRNDIAMTAPVEIEHTSSSAQADEKSMAFLYRSTDLGALGADPANSAVEVTETTEQLVVSIGCRGRMNDATIAAAAEKLHAWLATQNGRYEVTGSLRHLGYNSPMVPNFLRYFEVQLPIRDSATN